MKGWFDIDSEYTGDRTLQEQLIGLEIVRQHAEGTDVLDLGCAEGLIGLHLLGCGARSLLGISIIPSEIEKAESLAVGKRAKFRVFDLNQPLTLTRQYDLVLMLSILHKLSEPWVFLDQILGYASSRVVVRLPGPVIYDPRSNFRPVNVRKLFQQRGWNLTAEPKGPRGEWLGIFDA